MLLIFQSELWYLWLYFVTLLNLSHSSWCPDNHGILVHDVCDICDICLPVTISLCWGLCLHQYHSSNEMFWFFYAEISDDNDHDNEDSDSITTCVMLVLTELFQVRPMTSCKKFIKELAQVVCISSFTCWLCIISIRSGPRKWDWWNRTLRNWWPSSFWTNVTRCLYVCTTAHCHHWEVINNVSEM